MHTKTRNTAATSSQLDPALSDSPRVTPNLISPNRAWIVLLSFTLLFLSGLTATADSIVIRSGSAGAIAYSPSTGKFGYGYNYSSRAKAERAALSNCRYRDARIVTWVQTGFCALVKGSDGSWGTGSCWGSTASNLKAIEKAKANCRAAGGVPTSLVIVMSSDGKYIRTY